jgi:hypothetical protein
MLASIPFAASALTTVESDKGDVPAGEKEKPCYALTGEITCEVPRGVADGCYQRFETL